MEKVIIYSLFCNKGGMLRIVQSLEDLIKHLPINFPIRFFVFSNESPLFIHQRVKWFNLCENWKEELDQELKMIHINWLIADYNTYDFFDNKQEHFCYDVHFLGRPYYKTHPLIKNLDQYNSFYAQKEIEKSPIDSFSFLKKETELFKKASRFICNSYYTAKALENHYHDVVSKKPITQIPPGFIPPILKEDIKQNKIFYSHGRCLPQKGLHYLFDNDWSELGLTIRGFEEYYLTEDRIQWLKSKGITPKPWTNHYEEINHDLLEHEFILFPSFYETFGLSLQEALSLGKICFANKLAPGHKEQINHGVNGFLIDFTVENLSQELMKIYHKYIENIKEIKINAKKSVLNNENRSHQILQFLNELLDEEAHSV